jgi:hypothetical protein
MPPLSAPCTIWPAEPISLLQHTASSPRAFRLGRCKPTHSFLGSGSGLACCPTWTCCVADWRKQGPEIDNDSGYRLESWEFESLWASWCPWTRIKDWSSDGRRLQADPMRAVYLNHCSLPYVSELQDYTSLLVHHLSWRVRCVVCAGCTSHAVRALEPEVRPVSSKGQHTC